MPFPFTASSSPTLIRAMVLALALLMLSPTWMKARKRDKQDGRGMAAYNAIEPDPLPAQAPLDVRAQKATTAEHRSESFINTRFKEGIDVSHYQGRIDWEALMKGSEISYVYLKATEGAALADDTYERNLREARKVGLSVGSYHFYRPNVAWDEQFRNLISVVKKEEQDLTLLIDIETAGKVSSEKFIADLKSFLAKVEEHYGRKPLLYTYQNFYNKHLAGRFQAYDFMIAKYQPEPPVLSDGKTYLLWQYTDKGRLPGIAGGVDRSRLVGNSSLESLRM